MNYSIFRVLIVLLAPLTTISTSSVHADADKAAIDQAVELTNHQKYQQVYDILKPLADKNNAYAYDRLGVLHGSNTNNNPHYNLEKELSAYYIAAKAGIAHAKFGYASSLRRKVTYRDKPDIYKKNYAEACNWYKKSALQGFGYAQVETAWCYEQGRFDGIKNYTKAYMWFALAANRFEVEDDPYSPNSMTSKLMQRVAKKGKLSENQIRQALEMAREIEKNRLANTAQPAK